MKERVMPPAPTHEEIRDIARAVEELTEMYNIEGPEAEALMLSVGILKRLADRVYKLEKATGQVLARMN